MALSSELGNKPAKVAIIAHTVHEIGEKAEKVKGAIEKVQKDVKKINEASASELDKLDASKAVVKALIESSQRATKIWVDMRKLLANEKESRLGDLAKPRAESIERLARRTLKMPTLLTDGELDQIETLYLYEMIKAYAKVSVSVTATSSWLGTGRTIEGLNNTQEATIIDLFGMHSKVKRGRFFFYPPALDIYAQLNMWGVKQTTKYIILGAS